MTATIIAADDGVNGVELWRTNGTAAGTSLVKDIASGSAGSNPSNYAAGTGAQLPFAVVGNYAYFSANDGVHGTQLWRSDGTAAGTTALTNVTGGAGPSNIVAANGLIFFLGVDAGAVYGIYSFNPNTSAVTRITDASGTTSGVVGLTGFTAAGNNIYWSNDAGGSAGDGLRTSSGGAVTKLTNDRNTFKLVGGSNGAWLLATGNASNPITYFSGNTALAVTGGVYAANAVVLNGILFYTNLAGNTLYYANGATQTTLKTGLDMVTDAPSFALIGSSKLIFTAHDASNGTELWVSDATAAGTVLLKDIIAGATSSTPKNLTTVGNTVFFQASDGNMGLDLWKTDGTLAGTVKVQHIISAQFGQSGLQQAQDLTNFSAQNGTLYFSADNGTSGPELWKSDGTAAGTVLVRESNATSQANASYDGPNPTSAVTLGATTLFTGQNVAGGVELWKTDGTSAGTVLLKDIEPGFVSSRPSYLTVSGAKAYFTAYTASAGAELWVTDGTAAGTTLVKEVQAGTTGASIFGLFAYSGGVLFGAGDANGYELWKSDGTTGGTSLVKDIYAGAVSSNVNGFKTVGTTTFFAATTAANGQELWKTDGTTAGTVLVKDILVGVNSSINDTNSFIALGNSLIFTADDGTNGSEVWISDGTSAGTTVLKNINATAGAGSFANSFVSANGKVYFLANDGTKTVPWVTDGTPAGTTAISSASNVNPQYLTATGNGVYYSGFLTGAGQEFIGILANGSQSTSDIASGAASSNPQYLTAVGNTLFFTAQDTTTNGTELWSTTSPSTIPTLVKNINPTASASSNPSNLTAVGSKLYFTADDGSHGVELWVSDGTSNGTTLVKDINGTSLGSGVFGLKAVGSRLMFTANDGVNGSELYITDGTAAGTVRVTDAQNPLGANPSNFTTIALNIPPPLPSDFDADGKADILWRSDAGQVAWWTLNGTAQLGATLVGSFDPSWRIRAVGDADGDGRADIFWQNDNGQAGVSLAGAATIVGIGSNPGTTWHVDGAGDFDGDGKADILWHSDAGQVAYWSLNGTSQLGGTSVGSFDSSWKIKATGDTNGDGKADIFWQNDNGQAGISLAGASSITGIGSNPGTTWHVVGAGDFDGDSKADILWRSDTGQVAFWSLNGTSQLGGTVVGTFDIGWKVKMVGDTNGDGKADIIWQNDTGQAGVSLTGTPSIVSVGSNPGTSWHTGGATNTVTTGTKTARDFDGDGKADILWRSDAGQVAYWTLNGTTQLGGTLVGTFDTSWKIRATGDANGDGKADIFWQNDNGQAGVSLAGVTSITAVGSNPGTAWHVDGAGDFDGDGKADILWRSDAGQVAYWTLNGTTQLGGTLVGSFDTSWKIKATGDTNGDGKADIFWQNDNGQAGVSLSGSTSIASIGGNPGTSWHVMAAGDFDGDGKADILWRSDAGQVAYWTLNGTTQLGGTLVGTFDTSWQIKAAADTNADGKADIFWQNDSGQAGVSLAGMTAITSIGSNPGTAWHLATG